MVVVFIDDSCIADAMHYISLSVPAAARVTIPRVNGGVTRVQAYVKRYGFWWKVAEQSDTNATVLDESEGGPGLRRCAEIIRAESAQPAVDLTRLVDWVFFNLYVGNNDSHAKNLSIYHLPDKGAVLTPFYDLVCTRVYKNLSASFAFAVGGQRNPGNIEYPHIVAMAKDIGIRPDFAFERAEALAAFIPEAIEASIEEVTPHLDNSGREMAANLRKLVLVTTRKSTTRISRKPAHI